MVDRSPSLAHSLIAGGIAGTSVDLIFFPLDTLKTRLQSSQGFWRAGGFSKIYKGVGSVMIGGAPGAAAFFSTYELSKRVIPLSDNLAPVKHMISASLGEVAACLIRVPTEVVKTRTQTSAYGELGNSSMLALKTILAREGVLGLYRGFGITIMREIPFTSLQFPLYEFLKIRLARRLGKNSLHASEAAVCGSVAGGVAAVLTTPLDVIKTRVMLDLRITSEGQLSFLGRTVKDIYRDGGIKAMFAGVVPRTVWISLGGAVFLGVYEWGVRGLQGIRS